MAFEYTKKAKDTMYAGCLFRSRLEATWAAFFDICGIKWVYEPFDLPGWSPDFLLSDNVLAEVKPFTQPDSILQWKLFSATRSTEFYPIFLGPSPISFNVIGLHVGNDFDVQTDSDGKYVMIDNPDLAEVQLWPDGTLWCVHGNDETVDITQFGRMHILDLPLLFNEAKNKVRFTVR